MTDDEIQAYVAMDAGFRCENPFTTSVLRKGEAKQVSNNLELEDEEEDDDRYRETDDFTVGEKLKDKDFFNEDELEV